MRAWSALFLSVVLFISPVVMAQEAPRLALIPYLSMNLEPEEEEAIREAITIELVAQSKLRIVSRQQVQKKITAVPDGCPEEADCVASLAEPLQAQYLLFLVLLRSEIGYEVSLTLRQVGATSAAKTVTKLKEDTTSWSDSIRQALGQILPQEQKQLTTTPMSQVSVVYVNAKDKKTPLKLPWKWIGSGTLALGLGLFLGLYRPIPDATLGEVGPGVNSQ